MSLAERLAALSPAKLALLEEWTRAEAPGDDTVVIPRCRPDEHLLLSFAQERLWFLDQLEPGNTAYNFCGAFRLGGLLDLAALERSLGEIVRRHGVLRTTFRLEEGTPVQVVAASLSLRPAVKDLRHLPAGRLQAALQEEAQRETAQPFDLGRGPLIRALLLRFAEEDSVLLVVVHHIVSDGWSMTIFAHELSSLYESYRRGTTPSLPELPIQYSDFALWQRRHLRGRRLLSLLSYWERRLAGAPRLFHLLPDHPRPAVQSSRGELLSFAVPHAASTALAAIARRQGATRFMLLLAVFELLLYRHTGENQVLLGSPIANRNRTEIENLIGFFANTLVLSTDLGGDPTFSELLRRVQEVTLAAYVHQDLPFEKLVQQLRPGRDLSHNPLFQIMFVLQSGPEAEAAVSPLAEGGAPGLAHSPAQLVTPGAAKFDLTLSVSGGPSDTRGVFEYNADLFDTVTMIRLKEHLLALLAAVAAAPDRPLSCFSWWTGGERHQILHEWNDSPAALPEEPFADASLDRFVSRWAERKPAAPAVVFEGRILTYRELEERTERLAGVLRAQGVRPEVRVGLCLPRSLATVVAVLATWRAGGAYVPLDPSNPVKRLAFMMEDSGIEVLLTRRDLLASLPATRARVVRLDTEEAGDGAPGAQAPEAGARQAPWATAANLAYVMYTSGSTGKPKGVLVEHRGLLNVAEAQVAILGIPAGSRILQFAPLSFDASVFEIVMALRTGSALHLARQETLQSPEALAELLRREEIGVVTLPPSMLSLLPGENLGRLQAVVTAGEPCTAGLVDRWAPGRAFFNAYGPTETTIWATTERCTPGALRPAIGRPIPKTRAYVLDGGGEPVPVGVPGEICLGGSGLARGYFRRPDLTADRFIPDPFAARPGERLYRSGDLARRLPDGRIDYLGRIDQQVKVRGMRIEPGEVEAALRAHGEVREAVVAAAPLPGGGDVLVAWFVPLREPPPSVGDLRSFLKGSLPDHMVPAWFVPLASLPTTPSGKVDRQALPPPSGERPDLGRDPVAPRDATEEVLARIWAEVLGFERVGVDDDFFELGGHSLLATRVVSRIRDLLAVEVPLRMLFEKTTIGELAAALPALPASPSGERDRGIVPVARDRHRTTLASLPGDTADHSPLSPWKQTP
jgi:amino acid adenylation domain-containing protein